MNLIKNDSNHKLKYLDLVMLRTLKQTDYHRFVLLIIIKLDLSYEF